MKAVADALEVARSHLHEKVRRLAKPRGSYRKPDDGDLLPLIRRLVDERPTYGYRRITALANRELVGGGASAAGDHARRARGRRRARRPRRRSTAAACAPTGCRSARYAAVFGALGAATGALGRCAAAMRAHPDLVRGAGEVDTELMRAEPSVVAKVGAEATIGVGLADGRGLALKVRDGAWRAMEPAVVHATRAAFGLAAAGEALERHAVPPIANARGDVVGSLLIRIELMRETT